MASGIGKCLHKDYRNTMYPRSLGKPEQTKEEWPEYVVGLFNLWTERKVSYLNCYWFLFVVAEFLPYLTVHSITDAPGKVIFHIRIPEVRINTASTKPGPLIHRAPTR